MLCCSVSAVDAIENSWTTKAPMNYPRHNVALVAVDGKIYAIGGDQIYHSVSTTRVGFNERYDPKTNKWVTLEPMPTHRFGFRIVAYDGKLYCIGPEMTQVYDIATNSWSIKTPYHSSNVPLGVHVVDGQIFVILSSPKPSEGCEMYVYNPNSDTWTAKNSLPKDCLVTSPFVMDNKLMVVGTFIDPGRCKFLVYNSNNDAWGEERTLSKPLAATAVTSGLYAPQKIYHPYTTAINKDASTYTTCYDPLNDVFVNGTGVSTVRMGPGVVVVDDVLYVIGGLAEGQSLAVNEQYVPFGYHGTLPSGSAFSLDNLAFMDVLVVVVVVSVVAVLLLFFFKKRRGSKQVKANPEGESMSSSVVI